MRHASMPVCRADSKIFPGEVPDMVLAKAGERKLKCKCWHPAFVNKLHMHSTVQMATSHLMSCINECR